MEGRAFPLKKLITLCTACLLALSGCNGDTSTTPSPELSETPVATLTVETPVPTTEAPDATPVPTDTLSTEVQPTETLPLPTSTPFLWDGNPDSLTLNDFPTQLSSGEQVLEAVTALGPDDAGLYLVCQIPEQDTWLYAACGPGDKQGLILRVGTEWRYDTIPFLSDPAHMPAMAYGDFDGDQAQELAVVPYLGGNTGGNTWGLYMVDFSSGSWDVQQFTPGDYVAILSLSVSSSYDADANTITITAGDAQLTLDMTELGFPVPGGEVVVSPGSLALFTTEGDDLYATFSLDLNAPAIPEGSLDQAVLLHTEVVYTGSAFGLNAPSLSVPEI